MLNSLIRNAYRLRAEKVVHRIEPYIQKSKKIVDIGSGSGDVTYIFKKKGKDITPIDVGSFHGLRLVKPLMYDGIKLPFPNNSFDIALLLMVLHHTHDPLIVFSEAARVANGIVVIETSYKNFIGKLITVVADTVANLQMKVNWKSYKTDNEWKEFFRKRRFQIEDTEYFTDKTLGIPFLHILYFLKKQ